MTITPIPDTGKDLLKSNVFWSAILTPVAAWLVAHNVPVDSATLATIVVTVLGVAWNIIGRIHAKQAVTSVAGVQIKSTSTTTTTIVALLCLISVGSLSACKHLTSNDDVGRLQRLEAIGQACNGYDGAMEVAIAAYKSGQLNEAKAKIVDKARMSAGVMCDHKENYTVISDPTAFQALIAAINADAGDVRNIFSKGS